MSTHHPSEARPEVVPGPSGEGSVVLDIGAGRGALVVHAPESWNAAEIEVRRRGEPWSGQHVAVRRRDVLDRSFFAAVFGALAPGTYELRPCRSGLGPVLRARVEAGRVAEERWPNAIRMSTSRSQPPPEPQGRRSPAVSSPESPLRVQDVTA